MTKERTSVTVDPDVAEYLSQPHVNTSGLVNSLVRQHMEGGLSDGAVRRFRIKQVESELAQIESRREHKQEELEELRSVHEEERSVDLAELADAYEALQDTPWEPSNVAVQTWAERIGTTPMDLIDRLEQMDDDAE